MIQRNTQEIIKLLNRDTPFVSRMREEALLYIAGIAATKLLLNSVSKEYTTLS